MIKYIIPEKLSTAIFVIFILGFTLFTYPRISYIAGGADPSSYLESSRLFLNGKTSVDMRPIGNIPISSFSPYLYLSNGFHPVPNSYSMRPGAFIGLPLLISAFDLFFPTNIAIRLSILLIDLTICILVYALIKRISQSSSWACFGAISIGISPIVSLIGSLPMTDILSGGLAAGSWLFAREAHISKKHACILGFFLGFSVLTRLPNVLFFIPTIICLAFNRATPKNWWIVALSGLPVAIFLGFFNYRVYGSLLSSAYPTSGHLFGTEHFIPSIKFYYKSLLILIFPTSIILFPFSLIYFKTYKCDIIVGWVWVICIFGFYSFYYASHEHWRILRYTIPAWPALIACSIIAMSTTETYVLRLINRSFLIGWLPITLSIASLLYGIHHSERLKAYSFFERESHILQVQQWVDNNTSQGDLIICSQYSGSLHYYSSLSFAMWEHILSENWIKIMENSKNLNFRIFAITYPFEIKMAKEWSGNFPNSWNQRFTTGKITAYEFLHSNSKSEK